MKIGIDIVSISRVKKLSLAAKKKIFTDKELKYPNQTQASAFALKEAISKALEIVPPRWLEIELLHEKSGAPRAKVSPLLTDKKIDVSISHEKDFAIAIVVVN